ncbi:16S rRNA (cytidine(1402)-2'-O)-methyltransferase [Methylovulum psychrotolerans]|uniref:Ribosomal RNA small subunit methyltransferase I n=1 Tax=Methylovulum psychrotolerans TaxID=1704499 RepID=A0A1Z4C011_9GAMM|nr:16S rRNA (cytidine(1402)-2'-O)-methyltransferase [Methylovulum psychrotolerans]ASF46865.1 16S rRNA (cytidine(1402)-2'-O)-methyltransferase [Methylovulum psychrotolerans]MBT9098934.1 16S rRNA (cytidine(1402)-2'-O)-methyltransferase [Methylovulum psychrotolerans]
MVNQCGKLYVVATPIGNLGDISFRAVETLKQVDLIAAEDTRHVGMLLQHYGISNKRVSLHQHNEDKASQVLLEKLQAGLSIALVSDAGTPLLSDPGMPLVKLVKEAGLDVVPIPGACALIAALSAAGLPVSQFTFEGFTPRTSSARKTFFSERALSPVTWVVYESSHRILACLQDMAAVLPLDREIVIARELTKLHETIVKTTLAKALALVESDENMRKGEFVVIVDGAVIDKSEQELSPEHLRILAVLLKECSIKTAVALAVEITGVRKKLLYQAALAMQGEA